MHAQIKPLLQLRSTLIAAGRQSGACDLAAWEKFGKGGKRQAADVCTFRFQVNVTPQWISVLICLLLIFKNVQYPLYAGAGGALYRQRCELYAEGDRENQAAGCQYTFCIVGVSR